MIVHVTARFMRCSVCRGTGRLDDYEPGTCYGCGGEGKNYPRIVTSFVHVLKLVQNSSLDGRARKVHLAHALGRDPICGQQLSRNLPRNKTTWNGDIALVTCQRCARRAPVLRDLSPITVVHRRELPFNG